MTNLNGITPLVANEHGSRRTSRCVGCYEFFRRKDGCLCFASLHISVNPAAPRFTERNQHISVLLK